MFYFKKIKPGAGKKKEEQPIDVAWIIYIGMAKMGYSEREVYLLPMGKWLDIFDTYKKVHNFDTQKMLYKTEETEPEKKDTIFDL